MSDTTPIAGWYPDPVTPGQNRYWDGAAWTEHVQPAAPAAQVPAAPVLPSMDPAAAVAPGNGDQGGSYGAATTVKPKRTWLWILLVILGAVLLLFGGCTALAVFSVKGAADQIGSSLENGLVGADAATLPDGDYQMTTITSYFGFNDECTYTGPVTGADGTTIGVYSVASTTAADCVDGIDVDAVGFTVAGVDVTITGRVLDGVPRQ